MNDTLDRGAHALALNDRVPASDPPPVRVVVADDDEQLLDMLVGLLDDLGYDVTAAVQDGAAAVERCLADPPDVALFDFRMPVLTGAEAARQLHAQQPDLPVIILSAYDDPGLQQAAQQAGAAAYLVKGCSASDITETLDAAVRR